MLVGPSSSTVRRDHRRDASTEVHPQQVLPGYKTQHSWLVPLCLYEVCIYRCMTCGDVVLQLLHQGLLLLLLQQLLLQQQQLHLPLLLWGCVSCSCR